MADTDPNDIDAVDPVPGPVPVRPAEIDLDAIARDLAGVERALERLSDGTYWIDEVSGQTIPDDVLAGDPTARRA